MTTGKNYSHLSIVSTNQNMNAVMPVNDSQIHLTRDQQYDHTVSQVPTPATCTTVFPTIHNVSSDGEMIIT